MFKYRGHPQCGPVAYCPIDRAGRGHGLCLQAAARSGVASLGPEHSAVSWTTTGSGFDIPVVPFAVNCYGSKVISNRGGILPYKENGEFLEPDPPGPSLKRCMEVGAATARALRESPWRVALVASSSWSHAFLTEKNHFLWPDIESDRAMFKALQAGDYDAWGRVSTSRDRSCGPTGASELGLFVRRHGRVGPKTGGPRLR